MITKSNICKEYINKNNLTLNLTSDIESSDYQHTPTDKVEHSEGCFRVEHCNCHPIVQEQPLHKHPQDIRYNRIPL